MPDDILDEKIKELRRQGQQTKTSDFVHIFENFLSSTGIRGKTILTPKQRNMIYVYDLMHKKHPTWGLDKAAENIAHLFISQEGKSRNQAIELFRGLLAQMRDESLTMDVSKNNNNTQK